MNEGYTFEIEVESAFIDIMKPIVISRKSGEISFTNPIMVRKSFSYVFEPDVVYEITSNNRRVHVLNGREYNSNPMLEPKMFPKERP